MTIRLVSCVGVRHDLAMLPHFLRHYVALGVDPTRMHLILQASGPCAELEAAKALLHEAGTAPPLVWIAPYTSDTMWEKRRDVQREHAAAGDWVISADVDELHEYPTDIATLVAWCDARGINCIQGPFVDRLAPDGRLAPILPHPPVAHQFPVQAEVICALRGGVQEPGFKYGTVKVMALRGDLMPSRGGHHPRSDGVAPRYLAGKPLAEFAAITRARFRFAYPARVHHFKWVATLLEGTRGRLATPGVSDAGKRYGELLMAYFARHGGIPLAEIAIRTGPPSDRIPWRARIAGLRLGARTGALIGKYRR